MRTQKGVQNTSQLTGRTILGRSLGPGTRTKTTPPLMRMSQSQVGGGQIQLALRRVQLVAMYAQYSAVHVHVSVVL